MDCVYICRDGENEELRYSIRSVVKNLSHDKIWVVGGVPDWYCGNYIQVPQSGYKYRNARNNLKTIIESEEISDDFILMNDDFYIMNKISDVPAMHNKTLEERIDNYEAIMGQNAYSRLLLKTNNILKNKFNIDTPLDYELHVPMVMNKDKLKKVLTYQGLWRSMYGNVHDIEGVELSDVKVYSKGKMKLLSHVINGEETFLSSNDDSFNYVLQSVLMDRFVLPSKYEIESHTRPSEAIDNIRG